MNRAVEKARKFFGWADLLRAICSSGTDGGAVVGSKLTVLWFSILFFSWNIIEAEK